MTLADIGECTAERCSSGGLAFEEAPKVPALMLANEFLTNETGWDPDAVLSWYQQLRRSEPGVATRLVRELARRFLRGEKKMSERTVDALWKACKKVEAFGFARRILGRRLDHWDGIQKLDAADYADRPTDHQLQQQRALCTSKDPDLSAALRHDWALEILNPDQRPRDPETQGIAGGIWKRRWEWDGARSSLERSLQHYRAGLGQANLATNDGYCAINCAFVLDLLASLTVEEGTVHRYQAEADSFRQDLVAALKGRDRWSWASRAEALLGLGRIDEAREAMRQYAAQEPEPWELETTLRQLVRLGNLRRIDQADVVDVITPPLSPPAPDGQQDPRLTSVLVGRVGLALSGGGFRASLYHLGVLARLAESDLLRHVETLSCVSGGSIVGAHYYLALREQLESCSKPLTRADYVAILERVVKEFVAGVSTNVRTRVLSNLYDCIAIANGNDAAYADCVSRILHETFYAQFSGVHLHKPLHELLVHPKDAPYDFHPGRHNWTRHDKVPTLVINAATLNTGHSWQFTARSMGESPFCIHTKVDSIPRLRRANYQPQMNDRSVRLGDAVAASACVPGLFAPLQLNQLYPKHQIRLVDGGVFDNQGAASLIEQDCQVLFVSDASGQLDTEQNVQGGHVAPLLRSVSIFQERMRQIGYDALSKRLEAGQLRGLAYVHLTEGLSVAPIDWEGCEDPHEEGDQLPKNRWAGASTGYGVSKPIQRCLANMRTDLDVFSEVESAALMASGYQAMNRQLVSLLNELPALRQKQEPHPWFFSRLLPVMSGPEKHPQAYDRLLAQLKLGSSGFGRSLRSDGTLRACCIVMAALVLIPLACVVWSHRADSAITIGGLVLVGASFLLPRFLGDWAKHLVDPRSALRAPLHKFAGGFVLWLFACAALLKADPGYRERGRLDKLFN